MKDAFGPYRILRKLGEGGMGAVFAAHDGRLDREVAIKVIRKESAEPGSAERLLREARAAARVNHPNICQIFEAGEADGEPYLVMELLEGQPLSRRLGEAPMTAPEALNVALQILSALDALHARGVIHRDLKPGNVFLTPHGVKLLDFGLAKPSAAGDRTELQLTQSGVIQGTPRYMAPEQWGGDPASSSTDLYAVGVILFEMLSGRPAFGGSSMAEICAAVLGGTLPALSGGPQVAAADRIIARAMQKRPADRYASAEAMSHAVRQALALTDGGTTLLARPARPVLRLAALPLRILRPDPETDFLALGIAEEVCNSLAGLESIVVRSTPAAARAAGDPPDLRRLASELDVDVALTGTLLRAGDGLRVTAQLVETPAGTVLWSRSSTVKLGDLFALLEELSRQIVDGLKIRLSPREERALGHDVPASPTAYQKYLRANGVNFSHAETTRLREALQLYEESLREDPSYAPAWARLGRVCRIMGKFALSDERDAMLRRAGEAFRKALTLNPDLPVAHNYYTNYEVEELGRTVEAMIRLLRLARTGVADPHLFAGLTYVLRFAGLLEASLAADERARRLDPGVRTSAHYTHLLLRQYDRAAERDLDDPPVVRLYSHAMLGRRDETVRLLKSRLETGIEGLEKNFLKAFLAVAEDRRDEARELLGTFTDGKFRDPEGLYFSSMLAAQIGDHATLEELFPRIVDSGFFPVPGFRAEPHLAAIAGRPPVAAALARAERHHQEALQAFAREGGDRLLGVT